MSILAVEVREIESSIKHPNADRLDISRVVGLDYQFVTGREQYTAGDLVVYFPIDTIAPSDIQEIIGVVGKLSGANKDRVKTVKLRGEISQGLVAPIAPFEELIGADLRVGADVTELLGCTKHEPRIIELKDAILVELPSGARYIDLENAERHSGAIQWLIDNEIPVWITEKLEGCNFVLALDRHEGVSIGTRNYAVRPKEDGIFPELLELAIKSGYEDLAYHLLDILQVNKVALYGEIVGGGYVGNPYKLPDQRIYLFDVKADDRYLPPIHWLDLIPSEYATRGVNIAPELWRGQLDAWLQGKTLKQASNGKSVLADTLREGVVIKPLLDDMGYPGLGRLILKQRSPEYLAGSDS